MNDAVVTLVSLLFGALVVGAIALSIGAVVARLVGLI